MTGSAAADTIDVSVIASALRREWRIVGACVGGALLAATLLILFGPRRFDGSASAIVRPAAEGSSSLLARVGSEAGGAAALLGATMQTPIETEVQVMSSRSVVGAAVDSLLLQVVPRSPSNAPASAFVKTARLPGSFKRVTLYFERTAAGSFHVTGDDVDATVVPEGEFRVPVGWLTLRAAGALPRRFTLRLVDREEAITRTRKALNVAKAGGEVVRVGFRAPDSVSAATVPNTVLATYLSRRKTSDRGVNAHRVEFLVLQLDSTAAQLAAAEEGLRGFQERSGVIDAQVVGKIGLEHAAELRKELGALEIEQGALTQLLAQVGSGRMAARQLAAYPAFLRSSGVNEMLKQLTELETERTRLLERRTERDPEVIALSTSIANVEGQLLPLGRAYAAALTRQGEELDRQLGTLGRALRTFPAAAQSSARHIRDVLRLNQIYTALQTQLVQARLSALTEGGDVRALDVAVPPRKPSFPEPYLTTGVAAVAGLFIGVLAALFAGSYGRYLDDPAAIERAAHVPAIRFDAHVPLLMSGRLAIRTLLLIPLEGAETAKVATRLAATATARGERASVIDLSDAQVSASREAGVGTVLAREQDVDPGLVIVRLPGLSADATAAALSPSRLVVLIAPARRVNRRLLLDTLDTLRRLEVPCAGVVMSEGVELTRV